MILEARNITKSFGSDREVRLDSLSIRKGDIWIIKGGNGQGKTTIMKMLSGISKIDSGTLTRSKAYRQMKIAFVPQYGGLYNLLSLEENLIIRHKLYDLKFEREKIKNAWYIQDLGLDIYFNRSIEQLSAGFKKLASLACAFSIQPDGLFLDEPFAGLHEDTINRLFKGMKKVMTELDFLVVASHKLIRDEEGFNNLISGKGKNDRPFIKRERIIGKQQ